MAGKPRIIQLTLDDLTLVTRGGPASLTEQLTNALHDAAANGQVLYVRYSDDTLQVARVDKKALEEEPNMKAFIESEDYWLPEESTS